VTTNVLVALQRLAELLDMHIISTNMVSFDRDLNRKGAHMANAGANEFEHIHRIGVCVVQTV
jgi:hypothetical protein